MQLSYAALLTTAPCLSSAGVQIILAAILIKKGLRTALPAFFAYNVASAAISIALSLSSLWFGQANMQYFYLYWALNSVLMLAEFAVMYEVFVHAVKPYSGLIDLAKMLFAWAGLFLLLAAGLAAMSVPGSHLSKCITAIAYLERGVRMMQCGVLLLFFLFERRLGLSWRSHSVCVALGLGTTAATGLIFTFLSVHYPARIVLFDWTNNSIYLAMVAIWAVCFSLPQPERKNVLDSPAKLIFQRWNDALLATPFVSQGGAAAAQIESFLPNVEKTVERVMARKMVN